MLVDLLQRQGAGGADSPRGGSHGGVRKLRGWGSQSFCKIQRFQIGGNFRTSLTQRGAKGFLSFDQDPLATTRGPSHVVPVVLTGTKHCPSLEDSDTTPITIITPGDARSG